MKIRTITTGINLSHPIEESKIKKTAEFNLRARKAFEGEGYEVQSTRISTQPWPEYLGKLNPKQIIEEVKNMEKICMKNKINFLSIGTVSDPKFIDLV
ncbi:MAG: DUF711 family protein, partial [Candidatus Aenigmarchaeota archaeon]